MRPITFPTAALFAFALLFAVVGCQEPPTEQEKKLLALHEAPKTDLEKLKAAAAEEGKKLNAGDTNIALTATVELATAYEKGDEELGLEVDFYRAAVLYKRAATNGHARAQNRIGVMFEIGQGLNIVRNYAKAVEWYTMSAKQGYRNAEANLGFMYESGRGIDQDHVKAAEWYRKAAEKGEPFSQFHLGLLYEQGRGVPQNLGEAARWIERAAENGLSAAQFKMATMYKEGQGVEKDAITAMRWYERAARQGHNMAQIQMALIYFAGKDVTKDHVEAYKWLNIAAAEDDRDAKRYRRLVADEMTAEQIDFAQKRASEFSPEISELDPARDADMPR